MKFSKLKFGLVTGAGGFLGLEHCRSILDIKFGLVMIDINKKKLDKSYKFLKKNYPNSVVLKFLVDITLENQVRKLNDFLNKNKIFIRTLINNACIDPKPKKSLNRRNLILKSWNKELDVGLKGSYLLIEYFAQNMKKYKDGCIVNVASDLSVIAPNQSIYKSSFKNFKKPVTYSGIKHGLIGMTKYYASVLGEYKITCNAISPIGVFDNQNKKFVKELIKLIPMKRMAKTKDIKNSIDFLINEKQQLITGQNIIIDGGRTII